VNIEQRGEFLRKIVDLIREKDFPYDKRPEKSVSWSEYDTAQCCEAADVLELIREVVDTADVSIRARKPPEKPTPGRPPTNPADVAKALLAQSYFGASNRETEGLLILFYRNLGIERAFSYKTVERGYDHEAVNEILDEVFALTNAPVKGLEDVFSIDGSGTPTRMRQNYAHDRERQQKERSKKGADKDADADAFPKGFHDYVYTVAVIGTRYKLFAYTHNTTDHSRGETAFLEEGVVGTKALHPDMKMVCGDGLYAIREACRLVEEAGAEPRFLPRRNATFKSKGAHAWVRMLLPLTEDPQTWLEEYYQREASETGFSMVKMRNPQPLRKRLDARKCTEERLREVVHNIRRLCYLYYLSDLEILPRIRALAA
jgi:transposase